MRPAVPGVPTPFDEEDERPVPREGSASASPTPTERRLSELLSRRATVGVTVEGQQEIERLEQRLANLPRREPVQAPQRQDELTDIERQFVQLALKTGNRRH